jgi:hypothetical protein
MENLELLQIILGICHPRELGHKCSPLQKNPSNPFLRESFVLKNIQEGKKTTDAQIQPGINRKVKTVE